MNKPRLRIFAGPNGSGKSTLYDSFTKSYNTGFFLNSDLIEKELSTKGFIDLNEFNLSLDSKDLELFLRSEKAKSLIKKAAIKNKKIDLEVSPDSLPNWFIDYVLSYYL